MINEFFTRIPLIQLPIAILVGLIPYLIYTINQKIHKLGDPPWKEDQGNKEMD
jgi:hypothetical protein